MQHTVPRSRRQQSASIRLQHMMPRRRRQQPACSIPCGFTDAGLPVGAQLCGGKYDDARVLRAAHAYLAEHPARFPAVPDPAETA